MNRESSAEIQKQEARAPARLGGFISIALFLASLPLTGFVAGGAWPGYGILFLGLLGAFSGEPANLIWFCNPLLFVGWIALFRGEARLALGFTGAALLGGLLFLACRLVLVSEAGGEGYEITSVGAGYWLWIASMLVAAGVSAHAVVSANGSDTQ